MDHQREGRGAVTAREMGHIVESLLLLSVLKTFKGICTKVSCKHPQSQFRRVPGSCYLMFSPFFATASFRAGGKVGIKRKEGPALYPQPLSSQLETGLAYTGETMERDRKPSPEF